jgi:hypothetical protein
LCKTLHHGIENVLKRNYNICIIEYRKGKGEKQMVNEAVETKKGVELDYKCDCCGKGFKSHRVRTGEKLCEACIGIRRALKSFTNHGLSAAEVGRRVDKLGFKAGK